MKQLVINADDFGMSREVNDGIKQGISAGIIHNVSVMVNMPYFEDAVSYLKKHPEVTVGLHFNITEGRPLSKPVAVNSLIREDGNFFYWISLFFILLRNPETIEEIDYELNKQYEKLSRSGIKVSYLDSHHHVHLYPPIFKLFLNFAFKHKLKSLRGRTFKLTFPLFSGMVPSVKQLIVTFFCFIDNMFYQDKKNFFELDHLFDINWHPKMTKKDFMRLIDNMADGKTQIICHPGILSKTGNVKFLTPRQKELSILLDKTVQKKVSKYRPKSLQP